MEPRYKLKTAAVFEPVDIAALKRNLHILDTNQDTYLQEILSAVIEKVQNNIGRCIARATYTGYLDDFPDDDEDVIITLGPVAAISSIKYYDSDNALQTMDSGDYQLDNIDLDARLRFSETYNVYEDKMNAVEIEFTTGWTDAASVPKDLKDAIVWIASKRYLNPENSGKEIDLSPAENVLRNYRVQRF